MMKMYIYLRKKTKKQDNVSVHKLILLYCNIELQCLYAQQGKPKKLPCIKIVYTYTIKPIITNTQNKFSPKKGTREIKASSMPCMLLGKKQTLTRSCTSFTHKINLIEISKILSANRNAATVA